MDVDARRMRPADDRVRIRHAPRHRRLASPVAVARELAADPADRLADRDRGRHRVRAGEPRDASAPEHPRDRRRTAEEPAVEHESLAGEEVVERVDDEVAEALDDDPEPRADDAADRGVDDARRVLGIPSLRSNSQAAILPEARNAAEAQAEDVDGDRAMCRSSGIKPAAVVADVRAITRRACVPWCSVREHV
jgi:hypothetical protein